MEGAGFSKAGLNVQGLFGYPEYYRPMLRTVQVVPLFVRRDYAAVRILDLPRA